MQFWATQGRIYWSTLGLVLDAPRITIRGCVPPLVRPSVRRPIHHLFFLRFGVTENKSLLGKKSKLLRFFLSHGVEIWFSNFRL